MRKKNRKVLTSHHDQGIMRLVFFYLVPFLILVLLFLAGAPASASGESLEGTSEFSEAFGEWGDFSSGSSGPSVPSESSVQAGETALYGYIETAATAVFNEGDEKLSTGSAARFRLKGEWRPVELITARMELLYQEQTGAVNPLVTYNSLGINPDTMLQAENPQDSFLERLEIDHAWAVVNLGSFDISFGKLPMAWGNAWLYNPTDRLGASVSLEDREAETAGTAAIVPVWYPGSGWAVEGTLVFRQRGMENSALIGSADPENLPFGLKIKGYAAGFDFALSFMREVWYTGAPGGYLASDPTTPAESWERTYFLGFDTIGSAGPAGLYLEASVAAPQNGNSMDFSADWNLAEVLDLSAGIEYASGPFSLKAEYIYSSAGEDSSDDYDPGLLISGRAFFLGRHYLFLYSSRTFGDFFEVSAAGIINVNDWSAALSVEALYPFLDDFAVSAGLSCPLGPAGSEYNGRFDLGTGEKLDLMHPEISLSLKTSF